MSLHNHAEERPEGTNPKKARAADVAASLFQFRYWLYLGACLAGLLAVLEVYWPAVNGPFVLDDVYLPYGLAKYANAPLQLWLAGMRPVLMFSFWLNYQHTSVQDPFSYHVFNFLLHFANGVFIFLACRRLLNWANVVSARSDLLSCFAAGLFLLHPGQTESVSYIASRSETLSVFFFLAAFVIFLYRPEGGVRWLRAIATLILFALAVMTKEHTAILPVLLLLTDCFWSPQVSVASVRRNWRLYVPLLVSGVLALGFVWRVLNRPGANSAGFQLSSFTWYQYFFTQCRGIWSYVRLFLFPFGQNLDRDFPISRSIMEPSVIFGLAALVVVTAGAWIWRKRFPLAAYGWFAFLVLIAPTSSVVPILDPFAERRLYLPFIGLLLVILEFLRRWNPSRNEMIGVLGVVLLLEGAATYRRNELWGNKIAMWQDTVQKSPRKFRPRFQLAYAYYLAGRCKESAREFQYAAAMESPRIDLLVDWALAYDCAGNWQAAVEELRHAASIQETAYVYQLMGNEYGKLGRHPDALDALDTSLRIDPNQWETYYLRANVYQEVGNKLQAVDDLRHALALDPAYLPARVALAKLAP